MTGSAAADIERERRAQSNLPFWRRGAAPASIATRYTARRLHCIARIGRPFDLVTFPLA